MLAPALPRSPLHFSDGTACVWRCCLPPWPRREASARRKTRHQCTGRRSTPVIHLPTVSLLMIPLVYCHIKRFQRASRMKKPFPGGEKRRDRRAAPHKESAAIESLLLPYAATGVPLLAVGGRSGVPPREQPWTSAVTLPRGYNGLNARWMAVLWTFRAPSLGRHVHREFMRNALLDLTPIMSATACHQGITSRNTVDLTGVSRTAGYTAGGFVKLLRLRRSSGKRGPLPGPTRPLGGPLRPCNFSPTLESLPHLFAVLRRGQQIPSRAAVG
jgi:hypothetical protein